MAGDYKTFNDALLFLVGQDFVDPGQSTRAYLEPLVPEFWSDVVVGDELELWEGLSVLVGRAIVLTISDTHDEP